MHKDLLMSKYNIGIAILLFIIAGFVYGISCYSRKNSYSKIFALQWTNFLVNIIVSAIFTFLSYIIIKENFGMTLSQKGLAALFVIMFVLCYAFSSLVSIYFKKRIPKDHKKRNVVFLIISNPIFVLFYLWLFLVITYNAIYVPCGVGIVGIDRNSHTANTALLGIQDGERIVSIDGIKINSLQDVRSYLDSLSVTKEVILETNRNIYYVDTYTDGYNRYMGLVLTESYCKRTYN